MKIALFSDVHGNLTALEAVLDAVKKETPDAIVFAGDICLAGPRPAACRALLESECDAMIAGNTDAWTAGTEPAPDRVKNACNWAAADLGSDGVSFLSALPLSWTHRPTDRDEDALLVVHANPRDLREIIFPPPERQRELYGEVRQTDEAVVPLLDGIDPRLIVHGHLHIPGRRRVGEHELVNISSVHMPGDDDAAAKFAIATWERNAWTVTHHRVSWDVRREIDAFRASSMPGREEAVAAMEEHGYLPQRV